MASSYRRSHPGSRPSTPLYLFIAILAALIITYAMHIRAAIQSPPPQETLPIPSAPQPSASSPTSSPEQELPWNLKLVNREFPQDPSYLPTTAALSNGKEVDIRIYDALLSMLNDCRAAGLNPVVCSAYRSIETQTQLFDNKISRLMEDGMSYGEAYQAASTEVAIPGTSEHSLGLAVDICALSYQLLDEAQAETAEQKWLMAHCTDYGFILRFPKEKEHITGIIWEPWHYRYVGVEAAKAIEESGLCLEEYLAQAYSTAS